MADVPAASSSDDLHRWYERIFTSWNRRDAGGMAAQFAEDGNLVGFEGSQVDSRAAIEAHLRPIFAENPTAAYVAKVQEIRMLDTDIGLVRAVAGRIPPAPQDINPALNTVQTLVAVKDANGEWHAALFQSTPATWHGRPSDVASLPEELRGVMRCGLTSRSS